MGYFWVNQGQTFKLEYQFECLWAPLVDKNGRSIHHWDTMNQLRAGDIIINYSKSKVVGYCVAQGSAYNYQKPEEFNGHLNWGTEGRICDVKYYLFETPIDKAVVFNKIKDIISTNYSPFNIKGNVNQGYLYKLTPVEFNIILDLANVKFESINVDLIPENSSGGTETLAIGKRRIGQGKYRRDVIKLWEGKCAITGSSIQELLIASHIVPWKDSSSLEKTDEQNSILLSALYDKLFDKYLISFDDNGKILLSKRIGITEKASLSITGVESIFIKSDRMINYLRKHRDEFNEINKQ
jgi:putative restriction endonuclease